MRSSIMRVNHQYSELIISAKTLLGTFFIYIVHNVIAKCKESASLTWHRSMTTLSWIFCHKWALKIWIREILRVGILPCMKMPVRSSCTWKPTYTCRGGGRGVKINLVKAYYTSRISEILREGCKLCMKTYHGQLAENRLMIKMMICEESFLLTYMYWKQKT